MDLVGQMETDKPSIRKLQIQSDCGDRDQKPDQSDAHHIEKPPLSNLRQRLSTCLVRG